MAGQEGRDTRRDGHSHPHQVKQSRVYSLLRGSDEVASDELEHNTSTTAFRGRREWGLSRGGSRQTGARGHIPQLARSRQPLLSQQSSSRGPRIGRESRHDFGSRHGHSGLQTDQRIASHHTHSSGPFRGPGTRGFTSGQTKTRGGPSTASQGQGKGYIPRLTFVQLEQLSGFSDPREVINSIDNNLKAFQHSLSTCGGVQKLHHYIEMILKILRTICRAPRELQEPANRILAEVLSERCAQFHVQLTKHVQQVELPAELQQISELFHELLRLLPDSSWSVLPVNELVDGVQRFFDPQLSESVTDLKQMFDDIRREQRRRKRKNDEEGDEFKNWDNSQYRVIQLYPTVEEVCFGDPPKLRSSIIHGAYTDWEHYYDIQFRLLREDFIAPLRRGIREYVANKKGQRNLDVNIYQGVNIIEPVFTREGICFNIQFDISRFRQRHSWEHSKRLIFGSLLCLSPVTDNFKDEVYFAIVANRDPKKLEEGIVQVQFQESVQLLPHCRRTVFVMAESKAYFEASRHILRSLQTAEVDTMPFTKYLVLNQPHPVDKPKYLENSTARYDLRCLFRANQPLPMGKPKHSADSTISHYSHLLYGDQEREASRKMVDILDKQDWPTADEIELDQSQLEAIQMALTQEISIIQGPPGTGKTYIGLKIVQTLLQNQSAWNKTERSPILVLCNTNHALDQFLEGILDLYNQSKEDEAAEYTMDEEVIEPKIVRIGGRSQSERIQKLNIKNIRLCAWVPKDLRSQGYDLTERIEECSKKIPWESLTKSFQNPVIELIVGPEGVKRLRSVISPDHFYQLSCLATRNIMDEELLHTLEIWLGLWEDAEQKGSNDSHSEKQASNDTQKATMSEASKAGQESKLEEDEQQSNEEVIPEEQLIDVMGEAAMEEEARILDEEGFQPIVQNENTTDDFEEPGDDDVYVRERQRHGKDAASSKHQKQGETDAALTQPKRRKKRDKEEKRILHDICHTPIPEDEPWIRDVTTLPLHRRWQLFRYWIQKYQEHLLQTNEVMFAEYTKLCKEHKEVQHQIDRYALETADIIGMTTTGTAKYQHILHLVKPKIVIVEEAAEVLESHIVSSLNAGTQHLILIGDHKQLRPKPNEYDLAKHHHLDISLFERLLMNGLPHATLLIQHRMRPEIACLVCPHIYDKLVNHPSVEEYGNVKGFSNNLYFFNHEQPEEEDSHLLSHSNEFEAKFIAALCHHLLRQDYKPTQITVLTAYTGQLLTVRSKMPKSIFEGIRIVNVDNFQGEENDIIILSLVRSNREGRVGFLRESNRVCVALSRAKVGFYCFGNFTMLRHEVPIWETIMSDMEKKGCLGSAFSTYCQNHPEKKFEVKNPRDFAVLAPQGGCEENCNYRLRCGHVCTRLCHNTDPGHENYLCKKPCPKPCKEGHPCKSLCYQECPPCKVRVTRTFTPCGHKIEMYCYEDKCMAQCEKLCKNGLHHCRKQCYEPCGSCRVPVEKVIPICKHIQTLPCYLDPALPPRELCGEVLPLFRLRHYPQYRSRQSVCSSPCEKTLQCGHRCRKECGEECDTSDCIEIVELKLDCGHTVKTKCQDSWFNISSCHIPNYRTPCKELCSETLPCGHKCRKLCTKICSVHECIEEVELELDCGHTVKAKCQDCWFTISARHVPTNRTPCKEPCSKTLPCGHQCRKLCREICECIEKVEVKLDCGHIAKARCQDTWSHTAACHVPSSYTRCTEPCSKALPCGHWWEGECWKQYTVKCGITVRAKWPCGHNLRKKCYQAQHKEDYPCTKRCTRMLPCGHQCQNNCSEPCSETCDQLVVRDCACGHKHKLSCSTPLDECPCLENCSAVLKCGHICTSKCGQCFNTRLHQPCPFDVHVKRFCGHFATLPCRGILDNCNRVCPIACSHTYCSHHCNQRCEAKCEKQCTWECVHHKCTKPCHAPCNRPVCNEPCPKLLPCKHHCPGVCGEPCLKVCYQCNGRKFRERLQGVGKRARLETHLYIQLDCGHVYKMEHLDKLFQETGRIIPIQCPVASCCKPVISVGRYFNQVKERARLIQAYSQITQQPHPPSGAAKAEILDDDEALILLREIAFHRRRKPSYLYNITPSSEQLENPELVCAMMFYLKVKELSIKVTAPQAAKKANKLTKNVHALIVTAKGRLSDQITNDIGGEMLRVCMSEVTGAIGEELAVPESASCGQKFAVAEAALNQLDNDPQQSLSEEECRAYLLPLEPLYSKVAGHSLSHLLPSMPSIPQATKGEWFHCPAGHVYFQPAGYQVTKETPPCPECP